MPTITKRREGGINGFIIQIKFIQILVGNREGKTIILN
jgi:hypothetical protein